MANFRKFSILWVLFILVSTSKAQFSGAFAPANWGTTAVNSDGQTYTVNAPTSIIMTSGNNSSGTAGSNDFSITIAQTGQITFSWTYSTPDGAVYDYPQYVVNTTANLVNGYSTSGSTSQSGTQPCINVTAGDIFRFRMYTVDNIAGAATTTFNVFVFSTGNITVTPSSPSVCAGASVALTATGSSSTYTWSGGITNGVAFNPTVSGIYTVTSGGGGCISSKTVAVTVYPGINISPSNPQVCNGSSVTLSVNGANTYTWNGGPTNVNYSVAPSSNSTYSASGTTTAGCNSNATVGVTVFNSVPVLTVVSTNTTNGVCPGKSVTLTATGATSYAWTGGISNGVGFAPLVSNSYTVTGTNVCGNSTAAVSVSIHPNPTITASPSSASVCSTNSVLVIGGGGVSYTWTPFPTQNAVAFYPFNTTTYTVIGSSALGCTNSAQTTITVVTTPGIPPQSTSTLLCIGSSATLSASGAIGYSWTPIVSSASSLVVTPNSTTTYTLTKWNANCFNTQNLTVVVNQLPVVFAVAAPGTVCAGTNATLQAGGGVSYSWSPGNLPSGTSAASILVSPQQNTTYTLTASDGTCINTAVVPVATFTNPVFSIVMSNSNICVGQSVNYNITSGGNYSYTFANQPISSPNMTSTSGAVTLTTTTNYIVTAGDSHSCVSNQQQVILVNPLPTIGVSTNPLLNCANFPSTLTANSVSVPAHTYQWGHGGSGPFSVVSPSVTTTFTVTGTNSITGCAKSETVLVSVFLPNFSTIKDTAICNKGSVNLTASGALSYTWTNGPKTSFYTVTPSITTVYTVAATSQTINSLKCVSSRTVEVRIYNNPTVTATSQRTIVCRGEAVQLYGNGASTYYWPGLNQTGGTITVSNIQAQITTSVIGTDIFGCKDTNVVVVKFSNCPGYSEYDAESLGLSVFPNPNSGNFMISSHADLSLKLINELGQVVQIITLNDQNGHSAKVDNVAAGIYFISTAGGEALATKKIVINR